MTEMVSETLPYEGVEGEALRPALGRALLAPIAALAAVAALVWRQARVRG